MAGSSRLKRNNKPSIRYRQNPLNGASFELSDFNHVDNPIISSENDKCTPRNSETKSSEILTTADLISAASSVWDYASQPLSFLLPKTSYRCKVDVCQGGEETHCSSNEVTFYTSTSADDQYFAVNLKSKTNSAPAVSTNLECLSVTQKISCFQPNSESHSLLSILHGRFTTTHEYCKENQLLGIGIAHNLCSIYGWMGELALAKPPGQVNSLRIKYRWSSDCYVGNSSSSAASGCVSTNTTGTSSLVFLNSDCNADAAQPAVSLLSEDAQFNLNAANLSPRLETATSPQEVEANNCKIPALRFDARFQESGSNACEESEKETKCQCEHQNNQEIKSIKGDSSELCLSAKRKTHYALAKQEHAFAGAMAGIFVSLCLHPVDTVKTVLQSCRIDQKPLHHIGRSIISERGVMGLYRGISSNIASSAPISAVYTFTYESVKCTLVPFFPKEYQSLAHCMAGGCASIATSFIFTPSERIKQQMQVGSHYRNCWNALIEIIQKGGLSSLYAGWGAVLCRNIPHSVIKFYTYERLKQLMLPSDRSNVQPNTLVTLVCGGLAASTAAFFTTPCDVVKTRYQTQIPGSVNKYDGVYNTLKEISKHEGLKGLYRGLTPRLAMYMIQGALFFASYESFKRLFSFKVPQLSPLQIQQEQSVEDDSVALHSPVSFTA